MVTITKYWLEEWMITNVISLLWSGCEVLGPTWRLGGLEQLSADLAGRAVLPRSSQTGVPPRPLSPRPPGGPPVVQQWPGRTGLQVTGLQVEGEDRMVAGRSVHQRTGTGAGQRPTKV